MAANTVDFMSHFYLHPSDNPDQVFVSDILGDDNYYDWVNEMSNALVAKNKFGFVDGSIEIPEENHPDFILWKRCNSMVKGWLQSAMDKGLRFSLKPASTAHEIWTELHDRFVKVSALRAYELRRALVLTRQDGTSVFSYYNKLKGLWGRLEMVRPTPRCTCKCTCGFDKLLDQRQEQERLFELLMGLDEQFSAVRTRILFMDPTPSVIAAYHMILDDELLRKISTREKLALPRRDESKPRCSSCQKVGHTEDACYKQVGYPSR